MHNTIQLLNNLALRFSGPYYGHYGNSGHGAKINKELLQIFFIGMAVVLAGFFYFTWRNERYWGKKIFPPKLKFTEKNLMKAYMVAAGMILQKDRVKVAAKLAYINGYMLRCFPGMYKDAELSYNEAMQRQVTLKSLASWLNQHLEAEKRQWVIDFLIGLAYYDGEINEHEQVMIRVLTAELKLDPSQTEEKLTEYRSQSRYSLQNGGQDLTKQRSEVVLGLNPGSSQEEIKKVYRTLVKLYHPDKFMQESAEVREKAAAKFREIQEAYECLIG